MRLSPIAALIAAAQTARHPCCTDLAGGGWVRDELRRLRLASVSRSW